MERPVLTGVQMSEQRNREEAVNTQLALLISKLAVTADADEQPDAAT